MMPPNPVLARLINSVAPFIRSRIRCTAYLPPPFGSATGSVWKSLVFVARDLSSQLTDCAELCGVVRPLGGNHARAERREQRVRGVDRARGARAPALSRQWLADEAKVSLSTLEKALAGRRPFTLATVIRLEDALGTRATRPGSMRRTAPVRARYDGRLCAAGGPVARGHLSHAAAVVQRSRRIFAYLTSISWDEDDGHLVFSEACGPTANSNRRASCPFRTFPAPSIS